VLSCPLYKEYRDQWYRSIANVSQNKWNFFNRSENDIFILLLQGTGDEFQKIIFPLLLPARIPRKQVALLDGGLIKKDMNLIM